MLTASQDQRPQPGPAGALPVGSASHGPGRGGAVAGPAAATFTEGSAGLCWAGSGAVTADGRAAAGSAGSHRPSPLREARPRGGSDSPQSAGDACGAGPAAGGAGRGGPGPFLAGPGGGAALRWRQSGAGSGGSRPRGYAPGRWSRRPALGSPRAREAPPSSASSSSSSCCSATAAGACRPAGPRGRPWCWVRVGGQRCVRLAPRNLAEPAVSAAAPRQGGGGRPGARRAQPRGCAPRPGAAARGLRGVSLSDPALWGAPVAAGNGGRRRWASPS